MNDAVRKLLTTCGDCQRSGPTRTVAGDVREYRLCRGCWEQARIARARFGMAPLAPWPDPETNYDPAKGEPGTR